ncbi:TonB-dependent receptor domain-containing protein [Roseateles amylovorans]|uniref:TonB-dependent receptor n=1 Tax=Roseateles amylovorans TaxID=2978473 RepID=A0ABY6B0T1_9BURK|nr:TonB-dependent receptor [Roseateles amylovorans]UXH79001.1 TonB-dependent receptor [Roseateles amylovorans]
MKHPLMPTVLVLSLSLAYALPVFAQSTSSSSSSTASDVTSAAAERTELERVTVTVGRGQLRSVQGLSQLEFENATAGTSPLQTVARLPGVNFQAADGLGNYEWSTRFTVRSFSQNQVGFTLDDVPLGDMSYGNFNGLHISRAISSENVGRALLSQGAGALDAASSSNLGGTLQFYSADPLTKFGVRLSQTLGSDSNRRTFLRLDSGTTALGEAFISYTNQNADKWKADGEQRLEQWNLKWVKTAGEHRFSAFLNTSRRQEVDYQDLSLDLIKRKGDTLDNFYPDFAAAVKAANTLCGANGSTYVAACDDQYYAGAGLRNDELAGVSADLRVAANTRWKTTAYYHHNKGMGLWFTPYQASPDGTPVSVRTTEYSIHRWGVVSNAEMELGDHLVRAGLWFEDNDFDQARRFYAATAARVPSVYKFPSNPFLTQWQYAFNTKTAQFSLSDTWAVTKDLSIGAGFKSLRVGTDGTLEIGSGPSGSITAKKGFLPQLGLNYRLSANNELFATAARNMRAYQAAATGTSPYATTAAGFDAIKGSLKPETSDTFEAGWRTSGRGYEGSVSAYLVNFKDRLLSVQQGSGIQGNPVVLSNVGDVRATGVEGSLSFRLSPTLSWYNSLSLSKSEYRDDLVSNGVAVPINGKRVTDSPDTMFKSQLGYDDGAMYGSIGVDYMSKRYYTYTNDNSVPDRTLVNLSAGYRLKNVAMLRELSLQGSVSNLLDKHTISTIGSNGFTNSDPTGTYATLLPGAPRQFYLTLTGKF